MICQECGHSGPVFSSFCTECGQPQQAHTAFAAAAGGGQPVSQTMGEGIGFRAPAAALRSMDATPYASFLKRFVAFVIDQFIAGAMVAFGVYVYYSVKQETGLRQGTIGKSLLGLRVTSAAGGTLSVGQSIGRLLIKDTVSSLFFALGFLMAAFTERKQALHDFVAGTIVVQN